MAHESTDASSSKNEVMTRKRFRSLLPRRLSKKIQESAFRYLDYLNTMAPTLSMLVRICQYIYLLQNFIITFGPSSTVVWPKDKIMGQVINILAIIPLISPPTASDIVAFILEVILVVFVGIASIINVYFMWYFFKKSAVPKPIISFTVFFMKGLLPLILQWAAGFLGHNLAMIVKETDITSIIMFIIILLLISACLFMQICFISSQLLFRPMTVNLLSSKVSSIFIITNILRTVLIKFGNDMGRDIAILCALITIIGSVISLIVCWKPHVWVDGNQMIMFRSVFLITIFVRLFILVYEATQKPADEIVVISTIVILVIVYYLLRWLEKRRVDKVLMNIDSIADSEECFENFKLNAILDMAIIGFYNGHPIIHSWKLFDMAFDAFGDDKALCLMYVRFACLYQSENQTLIRAVKKLLGIKKHNLEVKHILSQSMSIMQQRERNLGQLLRRRLRKANEKAERCRSQIRLIWECIIRGNISEVDQLASSLIDNEEDTLAEFSQLSLVYPNNPYVAHDFSKFYSEIVCDQILAASYMDISKSLRNGAFTRMERGYSFAASVIPRMLSEEEHTRMNKKDEENEEYLGNISKRSEINQSSYLSILSETNRDGAAYNDEEMKERSYLETMINSIQLPSSKVAPLLLLFMGCIMTQAMCIPLMIVFKNNANSNAQSVDLCIVGNKLKSQFYKISLFATQYALSVNSLCQSLEDKYTSFTGYTDGMPEGWDNDKDLLEKEITTANILLDEMMKLIPGLSKESKMSAAEDALFEQTLTIQITTHPESMELALVDASLMRYIALFLKGAMEILTWEPTKIFSNSGYYIVTRNIGTLSSAFGSFIETTQRCLSDVFQNSSSLLTIVVIILMVVALAISAVIIVFLYQLQSAETNAIYNSFKSIPKSSISAIVNKLNSKGYISNENEEDITMSAQEENTLRVLSSAGSKGQRKISAASLVFVIPVILFFVSVIACFILLIVIPKTISNNLLHITPIINEVSEIEEVLTQSMFDLFRLSLKVSWESVHPDNYSEAETSFYEYIENVPLALHNLRVGTEGTSSGGINGGSSKLTSLLSQSICDPYTLSQNELDIIQCLSYESSCYEMQSILCNGMIRYADGTLTPDDIAITCFTYWFTEKHYSQWNIPALDSIHSAVNGATQGINNSMIIPLVVLLILNFLIGVFFALTFQSINKTARWCLKLFLFCEPKIVLRSKTILKILSNDFSTDAVDKEVAKERFYEVLISHLLDGALFMTNETVIISCNDAALTILGLEAKDILNKQVKDVLQGPQGSDTMLNGFFTALDSALNALRSPSIEMEVEILRNSEKVVLNLRLSAISIQAEVQQTNTNMEGLSFITLTMTDMTAAIAAKRLLQEEREKGESLLLMILPSTIVQKLQKGEKNISFAVQSASIMFVDIVSFTPWCGSLPAQTVMSTLNKLFAVFDRLLTKYPRLLKIKCIGDCYMTAGGIFDEVNDPAGHAKEAISFGLDIIQALDLFNIEQGMSLKVRAGINCGGPITAGVLGIEKPTFDILGPAISAAAAMEHNGVPMNVHIPQHMYELVYGENFIIKERGEVEIKGKMVRTYLVSGYQ